MDAWTPHYLLRVRGSRVAGQKWSYLDKGGSKALLTLSSKISDPSTILWTPPLPRHDRATLGAYPASLCFTSSAARQGCYCPHFLTEGHEAHRGGWLSQGHTVWKGPELSEHPVLHPLPWRLAIPTLSLRGSNKSHSLAPVSRTL